MKRARVVTLNSALGPLDYRLPDAMSVEPGSVVVAPLGPRQLLGVAWEAERLPIVQKMIVVHAMELTPLT